MVTLEVITGRMTTQPDLKRHYWCFISYSHENNRVEGRQWASWLHQQLETYEVPADLVGTKNQRGELIPSRIFPVFRDEAELEAGPLKEKIYRALDHTKVLIVLCSPSSAASPYVREEIRYFKKGGKAGHIYAALIDGEPSASFPDTLRFGVDSEGNVLEGQVDDPLAANFRLTDHTQGWTTPGAYGQDLRKCHPEMESTAVDRLLTEHFRRLENAKLQLIAGVLAIPLDLLVKRDKAFQLELARRKAKNLFRWLAAVAILAIAAVAGAVFAIQQRNIAEQNFAAAKGAADGLVIDIARDLRNVEGLRAEAVRKILTRAEGTFEKLSKSAPNNAEILRSQAAMQNEFVTTYLVVGDTDAAKRAAEESDKITEKLFRQFPKDDQLARPIPSVW